MDPLTAIGVSVTGAAACAFLARLLRQPLRLGYFLGGALLGPHVGFHIVADQTRIELIAEIGLILLYTLLLIAVLSSYAIFGNHPLATGLAGFLACLPGDAICSSSRCRGKGWRSTSSAAHRS